MISKKQFLADGVLTRFLSDFIIISEQFCRVYAYEFDAGAGSDGLQNPGLPYSFPDNIYIRILDVPNAGQDLVTLDKWDLVDNNISFFSTPTSVTTIWIEVATTSEEFGETLVQPVVAEVEGLRDEAAVSAAAALVSETNAGTSETNAGTSETNAGISATNAGVSETNADTSEANAATSASNSSTSAAAALVSENNSSTSETNAGVSAAAALVSENNSSTSETNAGVSETNAGVSETNAEDSNLEAQSWANEDEDVFVKAYSGGVPSDTTEFSAKHYKLKAEQIATVPKIDQPVIEAGTVIVEGVQLDLDITNFSTDLTYTIVSTGCTVVNNAGTLEVTAPTIATPSFSVKADHPDWVDDDSITTVRNLTTTLATPVLDSPTDSDINIDVTYTISSISSASDKVIFDPQSSDFTYVSVGSGSGVRVGDVVEITGWTGSSVTITLQYTAAATYTNRCKATEIAANYTDSSYVTDSIIISAYVAPTGGTQYTFGSYTVAEFDSGGTFNTGDETDFDILVVSGGGGGGGTTAAGGGGGAGGTIYTASQTLAASTNYTMTIGAGGSSDSDGSASTFDSVITTIGGGAGGGGDAGSTGGSGGGGDHDNVGAAGTGGQGSAGGDGQAGDGAGGGGGKTAVGGNGINNNEAGVGGAGFDADTFFGSASTPNAGKVAGGGGGGIRTTQTRGLGVYGGGDGGGSAGTAQDATANTGGGGGGSEQTTDTTGGTGGSGVILIRWLTGA